MPRFLLSMTSSVAPRIIICGTNAPITPCKAPPWCTRLYLRLEKQGAAEIKNREHFLAICAQLMRQILVEYARSRNAAKRDGGYRLTLDENLAFKARSVDMVALDDALTELARLDPHQCRIVELRFFAGFPSKKPRALSNCRLRR